MLGTIEAPLAANLDLHRDQLDAPVRDTADRLAGRIEHGLQELGVESLTSLVQKLRTGEMSDTTEAQRLLGLSDRLSRTVERGVADIDWEHLGVVRTFEGGSPIASVASLSDGRIVARTKDSREWVAKIIYVINEKTGDTLEQITVADEANTLLATPDNRIIVSFYLDPFLLLIWDPSTNKIVRTDISILSDSEGGMRNNVALLSTHLLARTADRIVVYDTAKHEIVDEIPLRRKWMRDPKVQLLCVSKGNRTVWDRNGFAWVVSKSGKTIFRTEERHTRSLVLSDGSILMTSHYGARRLIQWNPTNGEKRTVVIMSDMPFIDKIMVSPIHPNYVFVTLEDINRDALDLQVYDLTRDDNPLVWEQKGTSGHTTTLPTGEVVVTFGNTIAVFGETYD